MKKICIFALFILAFLGGCEKKDSSLVAYEDCVNRLKEQKDFNSSEGFSAKVSIQKITDDEIQYQFILDEVEFEMYDIQALIIHNKKTEDIFPSLGFFDNPAILLPNSDPQGIILVGYLPFTLTEEEFEGEFKVYLAYTNSEGIQKELFLLFPYEK